MYITITYNHPTEENPSQHAACVPLPRVKATFPPTAGHVDSRGALPQHQQQVVLHRGPAGHCLPMGPKV